MTQADRMNKYTLYWNISPAAEAEFTLKVSRFDVVVRGNALALSGTADGSDEQGLRQQADEVAHNLARSLSYERGERHQVAYTGDLVVLPNGQRRLSASAQIINVPTISIAADREVRDDAGNVIDSAALRREREQQAMQQRVALLATRAATDANLRDMLDHWSRYAADPEGRLHPLYDVLQVVERLYGRRKEAASALNLSDSDLSDLGHISNDPSVLNGRHPGKLPGPHRIATEAEVDTCERVARAIIENYAATVVI